MYTDEVSNTTKHARDTGRLMRYAGRRCFVPEMQGQHSRNTLVKHQQTLRVRQCGRLSGTILKRLAL